MQEAFSVFSELPEEIRSRIAGELNTYDLMAFSQTSRENRALVADEIGSRRLVSSPKSILAQQLALLAASIILADTSALPQRAIRRIVRKYCRHGPPPLNFAERQVARFLFCPPEDTYSMYLEVMIECAGCFLLSPEIVSRATLKGVSEARMFGFINTGRSAARRR